MLKIRYIGCGFAMIGVPVLMARVAAAQVTASAQPPQSVPRPSTGVVRQREPRQSLADILEKVDWDPATRGTLLIVSPEETFHPGPEHPMTVEEVRISREEPEAEANGQYRLSRLGDFYNRRLVNVSSISVFAPSTMAVLNTSHLPKPDAYAGMSSDAKVRLLESTFTPEQWRQIASPDGIGVGDLNRDQRAIFLSMLPDPFVVDPPNVMTVGESGEARSTPAPPITLSGDQRQTVRLALQRRLDWSFKTGTGGRMYAGRSDPNAAKALRLDMPRMSFEPTSEVFGTMLVDEVPSRLKPSQLPADWAALDRPIDIANGATVGDLVKSIAKQTGAALYCDPRYEDRKLFIRGSTAQASDVCKALAWGVTGTWRRLGDAFVLTDDLVGLGVRHAIIDNWIRENTLLGQIRAQQVEDALAKSHFANYVGWSATDPNKPDDALSAKIDAHQKELETNGRDTLLLPTSELPTAAQEEITQQIAQQEAARAQSFPNVPEQPALQPGNVYLDANIQPMYDIPGVGRVAATDVGNFATNQTIIVTGPSANGRPVVPNGNLDRLIGASNVVRPSRRVVEPVATGPPAIAFPAALANRALMIVAASPADVTKLAQEARRRGFTQLWVETNPDENEMLQLAVKAGSANGLQVRAVVPLARPAPPNKPELLERTILGESLSDYAKRWRSQFEELHVPEEPGPDTNRVSYGGQEPIDAWRKPTLVDRILRGGDFLRCSDPAAVKTVSDALGKTAAVNGLSGVVFRDIAAPGFNPPFAPGANFGTSDRDPGSDPLLTMGYDDDVRLACLKANGFDPIDLSPLYGGERINLPFNLNHSPRSLVMGLPFFPDYGTTARNNNYNGRSRILDGAKDAWERWCAFRQDLDAKFVATIADAIRGQSPKLNFIVRRTLNPLEDSMVYFGSLEGPVSTDSASTSATTQTPTGAPARSRDILLDAARKTSRVRYASLRYDESQGRDVAKERFLSGLPYNLQRLTDWDGIVVDLTEASPAATLELLAAFPEVAASSAASKAN